MNWQHFFRFNDLLTFLLRTNVRLGMHNVRFSSTMALFYCSFFRLTIVAMCLIMIDIIGLWAACGMMYS